MADKPDLNSSAWLDSITGKEPLQKWRSDSTNPIKWSSFTTLSNFKIAAKRSKHSARFANRIATNAEVVEQLVDVIKSLTKKPDTADEIDKLLDISKELLTNNAKLREQVEEALQDIPD